MQKDLETSSQLCSPLVHIILGLQKLLDIVSFIERAPSEKTSSTRIQQINLFNLRRETRSLWNTVTVDKRLSIALTWPLDKEVK